MKKLFSLILSVILSVLGLGTPTDDLALVPERKGVPTQENIELFERIPEYKDSAAQIMECKTLKLRYEDALELKRRDQIKYDMMMERYNKNTKIIKGLWGFGLGLVLLAAVAFFVIFTYVL